jgi:4-carboxymuconolactone decarboxylase
MSSTAHDKRHRGFAFAAVTTLALAAALSNPTAVAGQDKEQQMTTATQSLTTRQRSIPPIAAAMAVGDMQRLNVALNHGLAVGDMQRLNVALDHGLDAGLTVGDTKEILVQLYAYAGFPRSLNALGELMKVLDARKRRGVRDGPGREPGPVPTGKELLALGTANQTKLSGAPVKGPLFEFAPAIDEYLKTHLFGDIFARDNLDWQSRELATVGALAAMPGVESQLQSHIRISMNVGLTATQLRDAADALAERGAPEAAARSRAALEEFLAATAKR